MVEVSSPCSFKLGLYLLCLNGASGFSRGGWGEGEGEGVFLDVLHI